MELCNPTQEKIAGGIPLDPREQGHAADCPGCAAVAAVYSLLDATLDALPFPVPEGFADRVMEGVAATATATTATTATTEGSATDRAARTPARWLDRRWLQLMFAQGAVLCALINLAAFVLHVLVADVALGGTP